MVAERRCKRPVAPWVAVVTMSGVGGRDGVDIRAGGGVFDEVDPELRGEGGYNGEAETVAGNAGGGGGTGGDGAVRQLVQALERRIAQLEEEVKSAKKL